MFEKLNHSRNKFRRSWKVFFNIEILFWKGFIWNKLINFCLKIICSKDGLHQILLYFRNYKWFRNTVGDIFILLRIRDIIEFTTESSFHRKRFFFFEILYSFTTKALGGFSCNYNWAICKCAQFKLGQPRNVWCFSFDNKYAYYMMLFSFNVCCFHFENVMLNGMVAVWKQIARKLFCCNRVNTTKRYKL